MWKFFVDCYQRRKYFTIEFFPNYGIDPYGLLDYCVYICNITIVFCCMCVFIHLYKINVKHITRHWKSVLVIISSLGGIADTHAPTPMPTLALWRKLKQ